MTEEKQSMFLLGLKAIMAWIGPSLTQVTVVALIAVFLTGGGCNTLNNIKYNWRMRRAVRQAKAEAWEECRQQCKDGSIDDRDWRLFPWRRRGLEAEPEPIWMAITDKWSLVSTQSGEELQVDE